MKYRLLKQHAPHNAKAYCNNPASTMGLKNKSRLVQQSKTKT